MTSLNGLSCCSLYFLFNETATTEIYTYGHTLSLHDALPSFEVERGNRAARTSGACAAAVEQHQRAFGTQSAQRNCLRARTAIGDEVGRDRRGEIGRAHV